MKKISNINSSLLIYKNDNDIKAEVVIKPTNFYNLELIIAVGFCI